MIDPSTLSVFLFAVLMLFLSPGPNMAFVLSHGVARGPRGGFAAALGIGAADLVHTVFSATGITALVAAWPPAFDLLRYAGALYLIWLAVQAIRSPGSAGISSRKQASMTQIFRMAMLNNLLNPKALLFFIVFLPQFVDVARGHVVLQLVMLGVILSIAAVFFNTALGAFSGQVGKFLNGNPRAARYQGWFLGSVLGALALRLLLLDRPGR
ncbi:LysE family translocator [Noviherbaspirillum cavernae]|uniref:LysE family translocator n=1 Tax=Noviherbaspirillum cavernae TaxID=2320862 RepID=A0A418WYX0_9BURK|nr:LysE family translocator [Noviherbaspirillum cavernae]RJG05416.1 LysE family translocator [Noviherbaspirillum cavernae]